MLNVTGEPVSPVRDDATVLSLGVVSSVNETCAWPVLSVTDDDAESEPAPAVTVHVTVTPGTATPVPSRTITTSVAAGAVAVAVNVKGEPVSPALVHETLWAPTVEPSVNFDDAWPMESVLTVVADSEPPPVATAKTTETPATGFPAASFTIATNG